MTVLLYILFHRDLKQIKKYLFIVVTTICIVMVSTQFPLV